MRILTSFLGGVLFISLCFTIGCKSESSPKLKENTPTFFDIAIHRVTTFKDNNETELAIQYMDSIRDAFASKSVINKYFVNRIYADTYKRLHDVGNTVNYIDSILELLEENERSNFWYNNYIWAYFFKADIELERGNQELAFEYYYKALSTSEEYEDRCAIGYYYLRTGQIIFATGHYMDAALYFKKALVESENCDTNFGFFLRRQQLLSNVGICYERVLIYDSAVHFYKSGLDYIKSKKANYSEKQESRAIKQSEAVLKGNLGGVYVKQGKINGVEALLQESIDYSVNIGRDLRDAQYTRVKLSQYYIQNNRLREAKALLDLVDTIGDTIKSYTVYVRWSNAMWQFCDKTGQTSKAYQHLQEYKTGTDSLHKRRSNFSSANVDFNVKNIGNQYRISLLVQDAEKRKLYLLALIVIASFAIVIVVQVINNLKKSKKHVHELKYMNTRIEQQSTKLKSVLRELEEADSEKDRILKAVSHDMRSPVNSLLALVDLLKSEKDKLSSEQIEYIDLMEKSGKNALNLTKDLLEVATLNAELLEKEPVDITTEINARMKLLQFKASEKKQTILISAPANHITANVNSEKLLRVVSNLIGNAIKFSSEGGEINVTLSTNNTSFRIEVKDNGIGIPESMKGKVFDIFSDAKRFGTSGEQPYGLGLSISKQIVEAHNGRIWFESVENSGTTFFVEIPV